MRPGTISDVLPHVEPGGPLGNALEASHHGRLSAFVESVESDPIHLFSAQARTESVAGDWYGEHAGKWLIAASRAAHRTGDEALSARVRSVADFLCASQEPDGYLGAYSANSRSRLTTTEAEGQRTWDVWVHAYVLLGLIEVHRHWPSDRIIETCGRIVDLLASVFEHGNRNLLKYGNHGGLSSLVIVHPLAELGRATGESRAPRLAEALLDRAEKDLELIGRLTSGADIATIGTGKIYQLCWLLQGLALLSSQVGRPEYLIAAQRGWESIRRGHLTIGGGPWGGIGRHKEVFNDLGAFSPYGLVETCSAMAWIQLNRVLQDNEQRPEYAEEIEKTLYNSVLGAMDPNGQDWAYFTFPNGPKIPTYYWACCKSSGAIALEEAPLSIVAAEGQTIRFDVYAPATGSLQLDDGSLAGFSVQTDYPFSGDLRIRVQGADGARLRIPSWAKGARLTIDGGPGPAAAPSNYVDVRLDCARETVVDLDLPMPPQVHAAFETLEHHGTEIWRRDYFGVTRGPLVYAAGLIDGYKRDETFRVPRLNVADRIEVEGETLRLALPGHAPLLLEPYFKAGEQGGWRSTWLGAAWQ